MSMFTPDIPFKGHPGSSVRLRFTKAFTELLAGYGVNLDQVLVSMGEAVVLSGTREGYTPRNQGGYQQANTQQVQGGQQGGQAQQQYSQPQAAVNTGAPFMQNPDQGQPAQQPVQQQLPQDGIPF